MLHPNRWNKRKAGRPSTSGVTPKANTYDRYRRLEREILQRLAVPRGTYSYASLLMQIDPAKTGEGATILNASIGSGLVSRSKTRLKITERGRSALLALDTEAEKRQPKRKR